MSSSAATSPPRKSRTATVLAFLGAVVLGAAVAAVLHPCRPDPVPAGKPVPVAAPATTPQVAAPADMKEASK